MDSIRSFFSPSAKQSMIKVENFHKRKRTNADSRKLFDAKVFNKNFLMKASTACVSDMPMEEFECCYSMLKKENNIKSARAAGMVVEVLEAASNPDNARMKKEC